jgi:hypothetical protein
MSRLLIALILSVSAVFISGCALEGQKVQSAEAATRDFGECPTDYEEQIHQKFEETLKDPYSAHYEIGSPYQGKVWRGLLFGGDGYGWVVDARINAKNSFGGYTGNRRWTFLFQHGRLVYWSSPDPA